MTSQQSRRERASSDKVQAVQNSVPKRPSLPNRTNSAPVGALHQVTTTKMAPKVGQQTVIEEDQSPTATTAAKTTTKTDPTAPSSGKSAGPSRVGDEVCFLCFGNTWTTAASGCANRLFFLFSYRPSPTQLFPL